MISNETSKTLAAIDQLDATLDRIAVLPLHALRTREKIALWMQLETLRLVLSSHGP